MNLFFQSMVGLVLIFASGLAIADNRPNSPQEKTLVEIEEALNEGQYIRCSLTLNYLLQTEGGLTTPDNLKHEKEVLFENLPLRRSSSTKFASYSLNWESSDFRFWFSMNTDTGLIEVTDKRVGLTAESALDLSDFMKADLIVGKARLIRKEQLQVRHPKITDKIVAGEKYTYLTGSCHFLENYAP